MEGLYQTQRIKDLKDKMDFHFNTAISEIKTCSEGYELVTEKGDVARCQYLILELSLLTIR